PTIRELAAYLASQDVAVPVASAGESLRATTEQPRTSVPPRTRRSSTTPGTLLLQGLALFIKPAIFALSIVPLLVLFDLCAERLTTYQLLLTGPLWVALIPLTSMAVVLLIIRAVGRDKDRECELWSPEYFRWLFTHQLLRSIAGILGALRGTA